MTTDQHIATGCEWKQDDEGNWATGCGEMFSFFEDGPLENGMKFCCYCGLSLDQLPYDDGDEDFTEDELADDVPAEPCEHLRSEFLAEKQSGDDLIFQMRKCLDCTKIFLVRSSVTRPSATKGE